MKALQKSELIGFWDRRQRSAGRRPYSGYLCDESPPSVGRARLEGEWRQVQAWLSTAVGRANRGRCLDLGCGAGEWSVRLAAYFERVDALDWAPSMARAARRRVRALGLDGVRVHQGEIGRLGGRGLYDLIFAGGVLMYATDPMLAGILKKAYALLKPGGILLLRETTRRGPTLHRRAFNLRPGLLAQSAGGGDYAAVYRSLDSYHRALDAAGFRRLLSKPNRHYKFTDLVEMWLRAADAWGGGALSRDAKKADWVARQVLRFSPLTLWPAWLLGRLTGRWELRNFWMLCQRPAVKGPKIRL